MLKLVFILGLAGMYIIEDPDNTEKGLNLPHDEYDIAIAIQNKMVESNGNIHENSGDYGDETVVSGLICLNGKVTFVMSTFSEFAA